jgi:hypothetical protein
VALRIALKDLTQTTIAQSYNQRQSVLKGIEASTLNKKRSTTRHDENSSKRRRLDDAADFTDQLKLDAIGKVLNRESGHKLEAISQLLDDHPRAPLFDDDDEIDRCAHCGWEIIYDWDENDEHYELHDDDEQDFEPMCDHCGKEFGYSPDAWATTDDEAGLEDDDEIFDSDDCGDEEDHAFIDDAEPFQGEGNTTIKQESDREQVAAVMEDEDQSLARYCRQSAYGSDDVVDEMAEHYINEDDIVRLG